MTSRAEQYQPRRQVCCDPASHAEIRLTPPPAFSNSACQKLVHPPLNSEDELQGRELEKTSEKLLGSAP